MNPENKIELQGIYGSDITHALSAWTSTNRELTDEKISRIPQLLKMLAEGSHGNPHGTPFEKSSIHFLVSADVASHIHLLKHRIGVSINGESARYKELTDDKFYLPTDWPDHEKDLLHIHCRECFEKYHKTLDTLVKVHGFDRKRAKESARFYLPYSAQLTFDVMFNFRSFVHFLKLRGVDSAQLEIREIANKMKQLVKNTGAFEHSFAALGTIKQLTKEINGYNRINTGNYTS